MKKFVLKKGLDLPITGEITNSQIHKKEVSQVAIVGPDFVGMKPSLLVQVGDRVEPGQVLFSCKKNEGLLFCSRFSGKVSAIHRGEKRVFQSLVIDLDGSQPTKSLDFVSKKSPESYSRDEVSEILVKSGEWMSLRQRPFEKVAPVGGTPSSLFVTAMDTHPLSPDPKVIIDQNKDLFEAGLAVLSKLPKTKTYVCVGGSLDVKLPSKTEMVNFQGPHPAGLPGTHMHFVEPVNLERSNWHVGYQDVIAIGHLFTTGQLKQEKVVGLCGPKVSQPKLVETYRGAHIDELVERELSSKDVRVISGSVLWGRKSVEALNFVGQFHNQVSVIEEDTHREFLGWQSPGFNKFSIIPIYLSKWMPGKKFALGSSTHGSKRAMVPIGMFEKIMPLDILPTQLLRSLASGDLEGAQELGCLELSEEDMGLCTFVAPGKVDFGSMLRNNLDKIEKEVL